jgi:hypothetical protein
MMCFRVSILTVSNLVRATKSRISEYVLLPNSGLVINQRLRSNSEVSYVMLNSRAPRTKTSKIL